MALRLAPGASKRSIIRIYQGQLTSGYGASIMPSFLKWTKFRNYRGIAQSGSALALGARCREFKSLYPDQFFGQMPNKPSVVTVAQLVEPRTVTPVVVGSSPISHPNLFNNLRYLININYL